MHLIKIGFIISIFGQPITVTYLVSILLALWEFIGRLVPTWKDNPPTPISWIIAFLNWLNQLLNNKK
jgi:hypothetical protein